jgi:uncharacterized protein YoxC
MLLKDINRKTENADPTSEAVNHLHTKVAALLDTNHLEEK